MSEIEFCWTDEHGCICGNDCPPESALHKWYTPECNEDCGGCMWCAGGLQTCKTCGAFEGATPDHCPGRQMSVKTSDEVYAGKINYRNGAWHSECAQVMRHIYDRDNFMFENGYAKGYDNNGNPKWIAIE